MNFEKCRKQRDFNYVFHKDTAPDSDMSPPGPRERIDRKKNIMMRNFSGY